jgi:hypothetical protein
MRKPGTIDIWIAEQASSMGFAVEALLALAVADGKINLTGDGVAERINEQAGGLLREREATTHHAWTFETYTGYTVEDWPYVYTNAADRQSDAPYAFWLGKDGNPLDGTRLWDKS